MPSAWRESSRSFYESRAKCGGIDVSLVRLMKEVEDENRRLKPMYAEAIAAPLRRLTKRRRVCKPAANACSPSIAHMHKFSIVR